jgi:hypothetical protein
LFGDSSWVFRIKESHKDSLAETAHGVLNEFPLKFLKILGSMSSLVQKLLMIVLSNMDKVMPPKDSHNSAINPQVCRAMQVSVHLQRTNHFHPRWPADFKDFII